MYTIGQLIVYGRTGVCRVEDIKETVRPGDKNKVLCYVLQPLYQKCVISTPVENGKVASRPIISREKAQELIAALPTLEAEAYHNRNLTQLRDHYNADLSTMDCTCIARMIRSIYNKNCQAEQMKRKLGAVDERFWREAEELLFGELAAALEIDKAQVRQLITESAGQR